MKLIVVIPSYNEPDLMQTIGSLWNCQRGDFEVEILVVLNSYAISPESARQQNQLSFLELTEFAEANNRPNFYLTILSVENLPGHQTGAGVPRKIGMDEVARQNKNGIIVSLDADTLVAENYLSEIYRCFKKYKLHSATIQFHHPVEHLAEDNPLRLSTSVYENYLRYYRKSLEFTGYPYAYYTIGSAFAVTIQAYRQVGGMGKQQAGEDFYFLQKVFPLGKTRFIDSTCVYPAARTSDRVPFGTGPAIAKMLEEKQYCKWTYSMDAFTELKVFFDKIDDCFKLSGDEISIFLQQFPPHLQVFLNEDDFVGKVLEINQHTATLGAFKKRFFAYFTAFKILKYLNFVHPTVHDFVDLSTLPLSYQQD